jgi:hypothetical protein
MKRKEKKKGKVKENWWETKGRETKIKMNINETK